MDCNLPGSSVHGISQARILERVAISYYREYPRTRHRTLVSCIASRFFITEPVGKPSGSNIDESYFHPIMTHVLSFASNVSLATAQ